MRNRSLGFLLATLTIAAAAPAPALELGKMAPADLYRLKARTVCSCVFVQRMSLEQCSDGRSAIWRYASKEANPPLLTGTDERLDISVEPAGGLVRILAKDRVLAQSRYIADGGGCVTQVAGQSADSIASAAAKSAVDLQADSMPLPRGAAPKGVDAAHLRAILEEGFAEGGPLKGLARAAVVIADGQVVADRYAPGYSAHNLYYVGSIAKVYNNLLAGLLVHEGRLRVSDRVGLPQWNGPKDARSRITYDHLLKMASGLEWAEEYWAPGEPGYEVFFGGSGGLDIFEYMVVRPLEAAPGKHFEYSTGAASLLAGSLQRKLDAPGRAALLAYLETRLFAPLGARQVVPEFDPKGNFLSGHGVFTGAEDLARVGLLLQGDGKWDGKRLLPEGWVGYSMQPALASNPGYGAQLESGMADTPGCFGHSGVGENRFIVCPSRGLVLVWINSIFDFNAGAPYEAIDRVVAKLVGEFPERGK